MGKYIDLIKTRALQVAVYNYQIILLLYAN